MCGIVGLYAKATAVEARLGRDLAAMLVQMEGRGPDSAGVAVYRAPAASGDVKLTLQHDDPDVGWDDVRQALATDFGACSAPVVRASHAVLEVPAPPDAATAWLREHRPDVRVMSAGESIELCKEVGLPSLFAARFDLASLDGTHGLGHTRMATESRVTTAGSHPFSTGTDLCLVHNGSLSNHASLRRRLARAGIPFATENDTEVAAGYLAWRMAEGATLEEALLGCLDDLDGFYTFAVGTHDGFAVLRDPIACKPAVMAETDGWVAMASEYRAIAVLPGAEDAVVWEPEPARVYAWERERV